jgi:hypothetical protein
LPVDVSKLTPECFDVHTFGVLTQLREHSVHNREHDRRPQTSLPIARRTASSISSTRSFNPFRQTAIPRL